MPRWLALILIGVSFGFGVLVGTVGLLWATGRISEPSRDISEAAPTLSLNDPTPTAVGFMETEVANLNNNIAALSTEVAVLSDLVAEQNDTLSQIQAGVVATSESTPDEAVEATPTPAPTETAAPSGGAGTADLPERALFRIVQEESFARFKIEETLLGTPHLVIGETQQVAGDIIVNYQNPSLSQIGRIAINARTIKTDDEFRDQSIRGQILESSKAEYEFIYFDTTQILSLSTDPISPGSTVEFQVTGDLIIKDVTQSITFDVTLTAASETRIEGLATIAVLYSDFDLTINPPPGVEGVDDTAILELEFVAEVVEE